ncbi:rCG26764 [Rattus norvegicus]|uniref:RCG26764 n=1 Tax=Rattus norvegicus TaxID=10116 RepID=A6HNL2_RAT|nr:rCG26764 [Rattus norvegicus]
MCPPSKLGFTEDPNFSDHKQSNKQNSNTHACIVSQKFEAYHEG